MNRMWISRLLSLVAAGVFVAVASAQDKRPIEPWVDHANPVVDDLRVWLDASRLAPARSALVCLRFWRGTASIAGQTRRAISGTCFSQIRPLNRRTTPPINSIRCGSTDAAPICHCSRKRHPLTPQPFFWWLRRCRTLACLWDRSPVGTLAGSSDCSSSDHRLTRASGR